MNHGEHVIIGIITFFIYNFFNNSIINAIFNPLFGLSIGSLWLIGVFLAVSGSVIPDQVEPATHWTHRGAFHSKKALRVSGQVFGVTAVLGLFSPVFYYISCFFLGYAFHLLADSTTKVGLPDY